MKTKKTLGKRALSLVLTLLMLLSLVPMSVFSTFAAGLPQLSATIDTGATVTITDKDGNGYYDIGDTDELYAFAVLVSGGNTGLNAELTANIVVNEDVTAETENPRVWTPIGNDINRYEGHFNGNNKVISGIYIINGSNVSGLFGCIDEGGFVEKIGIDGSIISSIEEYAGYIAGKNYGKIENCYTLSNISGSRYIGGIAGNNFSTGLIKNCYVTGNVNGGMCGNICYISSEGKVENCYAMKKPYSTYGGVLMTAEQYASGEVAYLLGDAFGQKIGTDEYPVLGGDKVYCGYTSCGEETSKVYSNSVINTTHYYVNGFCSNCNGYEPATLNEDDVYEIGNAGQLYWFADKVTNDNANFKSANAILTNNIVINDAIIKGQNPNARVWTPIGDNINTYTGHFDGNNKTISGIYLCDSNFSYFGLFGCVGEGGLVDKIGIDNSYVSSGYYAGYFAGINYGTIENCYTRSEIVANQYIAGITGINYATGSVKNCYVSGYVGGGMAANIVYKNEGTVENCYSLARPYNYEPNARTAEQYASGEITYLLGDAFGQKIGEEDFPVLGGVKVYKVANCDGSDFYSNVNENIEHKFQNGFCTACDINEPATLNEDGYYEISNAGQLYWFADKVNNDIENFKLANAVLTDNIVVNEGVMTADAENPRVWTPIGYFGDKSYNGKFDGKNHTVSGLYFDNNESDYVGLFGCVNNGTVENIGVINSYFNAGSHAGGVVGYNSYGTITNCYSTSAISGDQFIGGVVGYDTYGKITNCYNTGTVSNTRYVGGVVGSDYYSKITNCYNTGIISGEQYVGGVVGDNNGTTTNCHNKGAISGTNFYVGGVVGNNNNKVINCYNSGEVNSSKISGGVVGYNNRGSITNCYNIGAVASQSGVSEGGVVGFIYSGTVTNCYYLYAVCTGGVNGADVEGSAEARTLEQFKSGEVALLLQGDQKEQVWGQKLGTEDYPIFSDDKVYKGYLTCSDKETGYVNSADTVAEKPAHIFDENGFCTACDDYEPAIKNSNGYYEISNAGQLYWFADKVNNDNENFKSAKAILKDNIVVNEGVMTADTENARVWTPIGNNTCRYQAIFDGNGKTISGLYFNDSEAKNVGLFGYVSETSAIVRNTGVINSYFNGKNYVGGLVGQIGSAKLINCYNTSIVCGDNAVGGLIGYDFYSSIEKCYNTGDVTTNKNNAGGLVGYKQSGHIYNSYNNGTVKGESQVGGLVGFTSDHSFQYCYNTGIVTGNEKVGGISGNQRWAKYAYCYYLDTTCAGGVNSEDIAGSVEKKTIEQFKSGEVAYLLQGTQTSAVWGQKINTDIFPVYRGDKVYKVLNCDGTDLYSNVNKNIEHDFSNNNGFCNLCDAYEPATLNADGIYEISNAGQLYWFADKVNNDNDNFKSANAILTDDIVVNEGTIDYSSKNLRTWTPIGKTNRYEGVFDGSNHTVSGLFISDFNETCLGLFGNTGTESIIKNVGLENSIIEGISSAGGIVGICHGKVINCYNTAKIGAGDYIGGIVGTLYDEGEVINCYNEGSVSGYHYDVGGIVGYNYGVVSNCYSTGKINTMPNPRGGIVGENGRLGTVTNCYYLNTSCSGGVNGTDIAGSAEAKTLNQFKSGEVAYLLGDAFGQNIGEQDLPVLGGDKVYYGYESCASTKKTYSNKVCYDEIPAHNHILGDIDLDGRLSIRDASTLSKHLAGVIKLTPCQLSIVDVNGDGQIDICDATYIQKIIAGLV